MAQILKNGILRNGLKLRYDSYTNQQFPIFPKPLIEKAQQKYVFELWENIDKDYSAVRFVTSWATKKENVENFLNDLRTYLKEN
jgi:threonine aldolase